MINHPVETSPQIYARAGGALYLIIVVTAMFAEMIVRERLVVYGDAATTATNILAHEALYRYGGVAMLTAVVCDTAVALIFYRLLKPVSRGLSLLATFFRLMPVGILAVNLLNHFAPLVLLKGAPALPSFRAEQLQALALAALHLYAYGFKIAMVFFGFNCLLLGHLIFKSAFLPRIPGVLMAVAGACYLICASCHRGSMCRHSPHAPDHLLLSEQQLRSLCSAPPFVSKPGRPRTYSGPSFLLLSVVAVTLRTFMGLKSQRLPEEDTASPQHL